MPLIDGKMEHRPCPIPFQSSGRIALIDDRYKIVNHTPRGRHYAEPPFSWELYDLIEDSGETNDLARENPRQVGVMAAIIEEWRGSLRAEMKPEP